MTSQLGLIGKGSKNFLISDFLLHGDELYFQLGWTQKSIKSFHARLPHTQGQSTLQQQHVSMEMWQSTFFQITATVYQRINQIETESKDHTKLLPPLQFEGGHRELKCNTTTHKTSAFTLAHVYQYTSYWIHNYIIRYNYICYGLVWQPNEAVIKELAVPLIRA